MSIKLEFLDQIKQIQEVVDSFEAISLDEMDAVKLMDRVDEKFLLPINKLPILLDNVKKDYLILQINDARLCTYETLYFDTPTLTLYNLHRRGILNRHKIRYRKYVDSATSFFEIKFKNNKGRTIKKRELSNYENGDSKVAHEEFVTKITPYEIAELQPMFWVNYTRITLVSKHSTERLTIDLNLNFSNDAKQKSYAEMVIIEVKQSKLTANSKVKEALKHLHIRAGAMSKYCLGVISLIENVRYNSFKPKLQLVNKILKQYEQFA